MNNTAAFYAEQGQAGWELALVGSPSKHHEKKQVTCVICFWNLKVFFLQATGEFSASTPLAGYLQSF
jgi:hypothetical protein